MLLTSITWYLIVFCRHNFQEQLVNAWRHGEVPLLMSQQRGTTLPYPFDDYPVCTTLRIASLKGIVIGVDELGGPKHRAPISSPHKQ